MSYHYINFHARILNLSAELRCIQGYLLGHLFIRISLILRSRKEMIFFTDLTFHGKDLILNYEGSFRCLSILRLIPELVKDFLSLLIIMQIALVKVHITRLLKDT